MLYEYAEIEPPGKGTIRPKVSKAGNVVKITGAEYVPDVVTKPVCNDVLGRVSLKSKPVFVEAIVEVIEKPELLEEKELIDKAKSADVTVVIIPADEPDELINPVNAYVSINSGKLEESFYLSCLIINKILENENLKKIMADNGLSEFNFQSTTPTDQYQLLESNNIGVVLGIWNSNSPAYQSAANQNTAFNEMVEEVKKSVNEAIDAYG